MLLGTALIASYGGVPLIYMGDEIALTNDYSYLHNPGHAHDSRWLHRPFMDWDRVRRAETNPASAAGRVLHGTRHILAQRKATPQIHGGYPTRILDTGTTTLFAFARIAPTGPLVCLFNFTENWQDVPLDWLHDAGVTQFRDALSDALLSLTNDIYSVPPYGRVWIT